MRACVGVSTLSCRVAPSSECTQAFARQQWPLRLCENVFYPCFSFLLATSNRPLSHTLAHQSTIARAPARPPHATLTAPSCSLLFPTNVCRAAAPLLVALHCAQHLALLASVCSLASCPFCSSTLLHHSPVTRKCSLPSFARSLLLASNLFFGVSLIVSKGKVTSSFLSLAKGKHTASASDPLACARRPCTHRGRVQWMGPVDGMDPWHGLGADACSY